MKILLAADGSPFTQIAARALASHVGWFAKPPEIHVVHIHPQLPFPGAAAAAGRFALEKYQREASLAALAPAAKVLDDAGVAHLDVWKVGEVAGELAAYVKDHGIDLVVTGSHGYGALANLALGSVAMKCVATLDVPVMIVRKAPPARRVSRREKVYGPRKG